jgi:hypothetical membrane protein
MQSSDNSSPKWTRWLLACAIAGSVLFVASFLIQGATREGYDPARNYVSTLSLGPGGWIQTVTFLLTGVLIAAFAVGLTRALSVGRGSIWIPRLIGGFAAGIFFAGVFNEDPGHGYPPGATADPSHPSWHAVGHSLAADLLFISLMAAMVLCTIRFQEEERPGWAVYTALSALVAFWAIGSQSADNFGIYQRVGLIVMFGWVAALAAKTMARLRR